MANTSELKLRKISSALIITIGILLMIYMISVVGEPGAIPLLLIALGTGWFLITHFKSRKRQK